MHINQTSSSRFARGNCVARYIDIMTQATGSCFRDFNHAQRKPAMKWDRRQANIIQSDAHNVYKNANNRNVFSTRKLGGGQGGKMPPPHINPPPHLAPPSKNCISH
jgi:hypothetical protein